MDKYVKEYDKLVKEIVAKSYPELVGKKIKVVEKEAKHRAMASYTLNGLQITMTYKLRKFSLKVRKRIITHELSHMVDFVKDGWLLTKIDFIIYILSKKHRYNCERRVDIREIERGYGNYILDVIKENKKRKPHNKYPLTEKEVKDLIKKYELIK